MERFKKWEFRVSISPVLTSIRSFLVVLSLACCFEYRIPASSNKANASSKSKFNALQILFGKSASAEVLAMRNHSFVGILLKP